MKLLRWVLISIALATVVFFSNPAWRTAKDAANIVVVLVPDASSSNLASIWTQSALEEGLVVRLMTFSEFKKPSTLIDGKFAGLIIPDTISKRGDDLLCDLVRQYVISGGKLMLVYDALTLNDQGEYAGKLSRLSDIAGVNYALYDKLRDKTMGNDVLVSTPQFMTSLGITPGRYGRGLVTASDTDVSFDQQLMAYGYAEQRYPFFQTELSRKAKALLITRSGHAAAVRNKTGKGESLFINLPIGLLASKTDRQLLQGFLKYFTRDIAVMPKLLSSPGGVGGLILNIHVDSYRGIQEMTKLAGLGVLDQGPHSIHFTAGPDVDHPGDSRGMDVEHNEYTREWIRNLASQGHVIGSHGGWIHNYFGENVNESNEKEFEKYLQENKNALETLLGVPVREYSSPMGNQPAWVTTWLEQHDFLAYYTTANLGSGPIRGLAADGTINRKIWQIPVTPVGKNATFEEAMAAHVPVENITEWLKQLTEFVSDTKSIRQLYLHPPGVYYYRDSVKEWMKVTKDFTGRGTFRWYTMSAVAEFLSRRESVRWNSSIEHGAYKLHAEHSQSLKDMTFWLPSEHCRKPVKSAGLSGYEKRQDGWYLTLGDVRSITIQCRNGFLADYGIQAP